MIFNYWENVEFVIIILNKNQNIELFVLSY